MDIYFVKFFFYYYQHNYFDLVSHGKVTKQSCQSQGCVPEIVYKKHRYAFCHASLTMLLNLTVYLLSIGRIIRLVEGPNSEYSLSNDFLFIHYMIYLDFILVVSQKIYFVKHYITILILHSHTYI